MLPSLTSLIVQAIGALLFATLCVILQRTVRREPLVYWSTGWLSLGVAMAALSAALYVPSLQRVGLTIYAFGSYVFGFLVFVGCRRYITGIRLRQRDAWLLVPAVLVAVFLPSLAGGDFNAFFAVHALIYAALFFAAFRVLFRVWPNRGSIIGLRVVKTALILLVLDYVHYAPLYVASVHGWAPVSSSYQAYSPLYDLIFLVLLAFGMFMITTSEVQYDLEVVNARLAQARDRLEAMAQLDHLTSALNRHAFYSILGDSNAEGRVVFQGCAAMADIDDLKEINDRYGHTAGDAAIRIVASAIRGCIRADDLLFRWGGDEFLVLLIGLTEGDARSRLDGVNQTLGTMTIAGDTAPISVSITVGYAPFDSAGTLEEVIALADTAMYDRKRTGT